MPSWQMGALGQLCLPAGHLSAPAWGMLARRSVACVWSDESCWCCHSLGLFPRSSLSLGFSHPNSLQMVKLANDTGVMHLSVLPDLWARAACY